MKPILWFASVIAVFAVTMTVTGVPFLAVAASAAWVVVLGILVHGPLVWARKRGVAPDEFSAPVESLYAVSPLDFDATSAARESAREREET